MKDQLKMLKENYDLKKSAAEKQKMMLSVQFVKKCTLIRHMKIAFSVPSVKSGGMRIVQHMKVDNLFVTIVKTFYKLTIFKYTCVHVIHKLIYL